MTYILFVREGSTDAMFWTSDKACPGFEGKGNPLPYVFHHLHTIDSADSPECDTCPLLVTSSWTDSFSHLLFQADVGGRKIFYAGEMGSLPVECGTLSYASVWRT